MAPAPLRHRWLGPRPRLISAIRQAWDVDRLAGGDSQPRPEMELYVNAMLAADLVAAERFLADPREHGSIRNAKVAGYFFDGPQLIVVFGH